MDQENEQVTNIEMSMSLTSSQEYNLKEEQLEVEVFSGDEKKQLDTHNSQATHLLISSMTQLSTQAKSDTETAHLSLPMQDLIYNPEYSQQIFQAWLQLESLPCYTIPPNFLSCTSIQRTVLQQMRVTLTDWLISIQLYLNISNEALQLTLNITDRYTANSPASLSKSNYQLIGLAALSIASKFEEIAVPGLKLLCDLADNAYTRQQLAAMEKQIYFSLDCSISNPQPIHFLRYFSILLSRDTLEHSLAKYLVELSLLQQPEAAHMRASIRAAVCLSLSSRLIVNSGHVLQCLARVLEMGQHELQGCMDSLVSHVKRVTCEKGAGLFVYQKYSDKKFSHVSTLQCLKDL
ncbi:G2/mitotic-specific cyclin-B-like isoform X1 [Oopsacas minuta]|uniref:G2/mitotic-specific cyclin-B-like isoform X1 n=1 Tax=Oopsacas minuta TaxID=111878 RepID=A0AAV7JDY5_9METZ|nr:G2/mitotic-specific cyclin-B-like isoform X1 [Oopsacas minuta]